MILITRAIEGISINGKEYLLNDNGDAMQFENTYEAYNFLRLNGFNELSNEELEDSFFFDLTN